MQVTPLSRALYFPMLLANGADGVTIGYHGSAYASLSNHAHNEQFQGCVPGWYRQAHRQATHPVQPVVQSGYHLLVDGEVCDATDYVQQFDPAAAILYSQITVRGAKIAIESFMTNDSVLVEHFTLLEKAPGTTIEMAYIVHDPWSWMSCTELRDKPKNRVTRKRDKTLGIMYHLPSAKIRGTGLIWSDVTPDGFDTPGRVSPTAWAPCGSRISSPAGQPRSS